MFCNVGAVQSLYSYDAAKRHFESTPLPRTKRRGEPLWYENERPLSGDRQWHYRVVQGVQEAYYDACLYQTTMVRWHKPAEDGTQRVQVHYDSRNASVHFLWRMGFGRQVRMCFVEGGEAVIPVVVNAQRSGGWWALDLVYAHERVIKEHSWHAPLGVRATSADARKYRRELLKFFDPWVRILARTAGPRASFGLPEVLVRGRVDAAMQAGEGEVLAHTVSVLRDRANYHYDCRKQDASADESEAYVRAHLCRDILKASKVRSLDIVKLLDNWLEEYPRSVIGRY